MDPFPDDGTVTDLLDYTEVFPLLSSRNQSDVLVVVYVLGIIEFFVLPSCNISLIV